MANLYPRRKVLNHILHILVGYPSLANVSGFLNLLEKITPQNISFMNYVIPESVFMTQAAMCKKIRKKLPPSIVRMKLLLQKIYLKVLLVRGGGINKLGMEIGIC